MKRYFIYMMTNWADTTLYTGITNDIERRVWEHKNKALKGWKREKKNALVESINQKWRDLAEA